MTLSRLVSLQVSYTVLGILYNVASALQTQIGGRPWSATDPLAGGLSMLVYAACLVPARLHWTKTYRVLMALAVVIYGYGGLVKHLMNIMDTGLTQYGSAMTWALAVGINGFGLVLNLMAAAGWFKPAPELPPRTGI